MFKFLTMGLLESLLLQAPQLPPAVVEDINLMYNEVIDEEKREALLDALPPAEEGKLGIGFHAGDEAYDLVLLFGEDRVVLKYNHIGGQSLYCEVAFPTPNLIQYHCQDNIILQQETLERLFQAHQELLPEQKVIPAFPILSRYVKFG